MYRMQVYSCNNDLNIAILKWHSSTTLGGRYTKCDIHDLHGSVGVIKYLSQFMHIHILLSLRIFDWGRNTPWDFWRKAFWGFSANFIQFALMEPMQISILQQKKPNYNNKKQAILHYNTASLGMLIQTMGIHHPLKFCWNLRKFWGHTYILGKASNFCWIESTILQPSLDTSKFETQGHAVDHMHKIWWESGKQCRSTKKTNNCGRMAVNPIWWTLWALWYYLFSTRR